MNTIALKPKRSSHSIQIKVGRGILQRALPAPTHARQKAFLLFDQRLKNASKSLETSLSKKGWEVVRMGLNAGEPLKEIDSVFPIYGSLLEQGADRQSVIFALGGGSIGDAIGFVASTYMRGIAWINIPTTLLAQVDSAIGGKTGINHSVGKNLIGTFHQPERVICDSRLLESLEKRDCVSGLGEIVKYGIALDEVFFNSLVRDWKGILALRPGITERAIARCAAIKASIVERDEHDRTGIREVLNFGHTVAHALEKVCGYGTFRHGEAVLWGMRAALALSERRKHLSAKERNRAEALLKSIPTAPLPRKLNLDQIVDAIRFDKKKYGGKVRFVLLRRIGKACLDPNVTPEELRSTLEEVFK